MPATTPGSGAVQTVTGPIAPAALGRTLIHEHLICDLTTYWRPEDAPDVAGITLDAETIGTVRDHAFAIRHDLMLDRIDLAIAGVRRFREAGGGGIVEVTSNGIGRDVRAVEMVARATGTPVVVGCGHYIGSSRPRGFERRPVRDLADELVEELTVGIEGTSIRAGVIGEIGVGQFPMLDHERRMLRAAALAQVETGAGIIVHPAAGTRSAFELVKVLERAGAVMDKVVVAHLDERFPGDRRSFARMAARGVRYGFDTFGREIYFEPRQRQHPSDTQRIEAIRMLWDAGQGDRIALAQDICLRHELAEHGGVGYHHVLTNIVPRLRLEGLGDRELEQMLVGTPAAVLTMPSR